MSNLRDFYSAVGGDYSAAINRVADDEEFLLSLLHVFESDKTWGELIAGIENCDVKAAFGASHSLKGSTGMLGLDRLYKCMFDLTEALRAGDIVSAKAQLSECEREYNITIDEIRRL